MLGAAKGKYRRGPWVRWAMGAAAPQCAWPESLFSKNVWHTLGLGLGLGVGLGLGLGLGFSFS